MAKTQGHPRESGRLLVLAMAVLLILFLAIIIWSSRRGATEPPSPVRSEQPAK